VFATGQCWPYALFISSLVLTRREKSRLPHTPVSIPERATLLNPRGALARSHRQAAAGFVLDILAEHWRGLQQLAEPLFIQHQQRQAVPGADGGVAGAVVQEGHLADVVAAAQ